MSVSKWAYTPEKCDDKMYICCGNCDNCSLKDEDEENDD